MSQIYFPISNYGVRLCMLSHFSSVWLFATLWTVACQAPLSILACPFLGKDTTVGPCPPPGNLPDPWMEPISLVSPALAVRFYTTSTTWEAQLGDVCCAKSLQSYPTFCDPMDCSLPGFSVHGILQVRILERVAVLSSKGSSLPRDLTRQVLYH